MSLIFAFFINKNIFWSIIHITKVAEGYIKCSYLFKSLFNYPDGLVWMCFFVGTLYNGSRGLNSFFTVPTNKKQHSSHPNDHGQIEECSYVCRPFPIYAEWSWPAATLIGADKYGFPWDKLVPKAWYTWAGWVWPILCWTSRHWPIFGLCLRQPVRQKLAERPAFVDP